MSPQHAVVAAVSCRLPCCFPKTRRSPFGGAQLGRQRPSAAPPPTKSRLSSFPAPPSHAAEWQWFRLGATRRVAPPTIVALVSTAFGAVVAKFWVFSAKLVPG